MNENAMISVMKGTIKRAAYKLGLTISLRRPDILHWLRSKEICTILDIGANRGQFAKEIRAAFPEAMLHCFEPLVSEFGILEKNLRGDARCCCHNIALGNQNEETVIHHNEFAPSSSLRDISEKHAKVFPFTKESHAERIRIRRLDDIFESLDCRTEILMKIDAQGFEDQVLEGAIKALERVLSLIVEISFVELYKGQLLGFEIVRVLENAGFLHVGDLGYLSDPLTGQRLQADAIFVRKEAYSE